MPTPAQRAADLTALGGFAVFQVEREGLLPLATALQSEHLTHRFAATRSGLAAGTGLALEEVPPRTAVSAAQIGLVSRLWSVALASVALHDWVPALTAEQLLVDRSHRNPSPMALVDPAAGRRVGGAAGATGAADPAGAAGALTELVGHGAVAAVTEACQEHGRTSGTVLVSNAASSLAAAARVIAGAVPDRAEHLHRVARLLLQDPWLSAGGAYHRADPAPGLGSSAARAVACTTACPATVFARTAC